MAGAALRIGGRPRIPAALPASTAALLKLRPGDVLRVQDRDTGAPVTFILTGLYAERQSPASAASYWQLNSIPASGSVSGTGSASGYTTYGPLVVSPSVFPGRLAEGTGTWVAQPDMADFNPADLSAISASWFGSSLLSGLTLTTNLPTVLADTGDNFAVARSLLGISALELLVLTVAALLAVARLLAAQREGETALLTARGATRWQLTRLTAAEVIPLSLVTALIGGIAGIWLARLLGSTLYRPGTAGGSVPDGGISVGAPGTWLDALAAALGIAVLSIGALLYPVLRPGRAAAPVRRGRQAVLSRATRAGADLALVALAVLACWQLRRYSAVSTSASGPSAIDPVLVLAPALALAAGTVLTLRLLPAAARAVDRVSAAGRGLTSALAGWQFSRQPLRQGGAALLLVMAVGTGTLALAQHQSWTRSAADQAAYVTGGDAQVNLAVPLPAGATTSITGAAGVRAAMAVSVNQAAPAPVVAIDAAQAPKVALLRADQSSLPPAALLRSITPSSPSGGLLISGRPRSVQFTVTLSRAPLDSVTAQFTVTDATGAAFQLSSGLFSADGRPHVLTASLGGAARRLPAPAQPGHPLLHAARETAEDSRHADRRRGDAQYVDRGRKLTRARLGTVHRQYVRPVSRAEGDRLAARARRRDAHVHPRLRAMVARSGRASGRHRAGSRAGLALRREHGAGRRPRHRDPGVRQRQQHRRGQHRANDHQRHNRASENRGRGERVPHHHGRRAGDGPVRP